MEAYKTPENWHTIEENGNLKYVFVNPATKRIERPYKTPKEYVAIMGIGNDRWLGGGVVNQDVVLVLAETQRNRNAFAILAENKRVDIDIAIVAIADNPLKIRTIYFAQSLAIYFA
jgi:hypothetical protein